MEYKIKSQPGIKPPDQWPLENPPPPPPPPSKRDIRMEGQIGLGTGRSQRSEVRKSRSEVTSCKVRLKYECMAPIYKQETVQIYTWYYSEIMSERGKRSPKCQVGVGVYSIKQIGISERWGKTAEDCEGGT